MRPIQHSSNTRVLAAPKGVPIEECNALAITDVDEETLGVCVASFWQPDAAELALLNAGHPVVLMIQGRTHPPLYLAVGTKD